MQYNNKINTTTTQYTYHTIHCNAMQHNALQSTTLPYNIIQYNMTQYSATQYSTPVQYNTLHHNRTQPNTTQHNTIQYNTIQWCNAIPGNALQCNARTDTTMRQEIRFPPLLWQAPRCKTSPQGKPLKHFLENKISKKYDLEYGNNMSLESRSGHQPQNVKQILKWYTIDVKIMWKCQITSF